MLSEKSRPLIQASVPVLREHGPHITRTFYANMFGAHPELKHIFNMGNQANGAQQHALASALLAYAANIDNVEGLLPVVRRIAHKHAAVGIKPSQYPIVGRHLLGAISQVLGAAATPDLLAAWDEAYWLLAGELIAAEARLYQSAQVEAGALQNCVVTRVEREADGVTSYYLERESGGSPGAFEPGQYVSVAVSLEDSGLRQLRQYSLSDAPSRPYWRLSVKREDAQASQPPGQVSCYLHAHISKDRQLQVSAPFGDFTPLRSSDPGKPLVLLCAGIGITPMLSVLNTLAQAHSPRNVLFAHAARNPEHLLFAPELRAAKAQLAGLRSVAFCEQLQEQPARTGDAQNIQRGRMSVTPALLDGFADADFFLCGPEPFMREQWRALVGHGVSPLRIQREVFGPALLEHLA